MLVLEPNGYPQGAQNRSKSSKIWFRRPLWEHLLKSHQKLRILGTLPTSKYRVSCNRGIKNQEIAGPQKCHQNDLQMPPILDASGTIFCKKCLPEGYQKMHVKLRPKHIKNYLKMTSKCLPFWMLLAPHLPKSGFQKGTRKCIKKWIQKVFKNDLKRDEGLARKRHQNHKNPSLGLKMCPKPPGRVPRHLNIQKSTKNQFPGSRNHSKSKAVSRNLLAFSWKFWSYIARASLRIISC